MHSAKEFGIRVTRTSGEEEYCVCPFHADSNQSSSFNRRKGVLYCFVCGRGWNLDQLQDALEVQLDYQEPQEPDDYNLFSDPEHFDLGVATYTDYFQERGISPQMIERYGVRWKGYGTPAAVLPIMNLRGQLKGVMNRYITGPLRYQVYGEPPPVWPMPFLTKGKRFLVTEGAWSAMKIATYLDGDFRLFVPLALLGAKANRKIVETLGSFDVTFLYDGDGAGRTACRKMMSLFPTANSFVVKTSPDDMSPAQLEELLVTVERRW